MTLLKVNNRPEVRSWNGLVNDLFNGFDNSYFGYKQNGNLAPVNIAETEDSYHLELAAPGRSKENFSLNVENNILTIGFEAKKETETKELKQVRKEFSFQSFKRSFSLDDKVNTEEIQAKYEDGILKVLLPKKAETKPAAKQISIQ